MAAAPLVSTAIGVGGTISGLVSQRRQRNQQLIAVNQQIAADAQASAARIAEQENQRQYLLQTYQLESMQRRLASDPNNLLQAAVDNKLQNTSAVAQINNAGASANRQLNDAEIGVKNNALNANNAVSSEVYQTLLESAKTSQSAAQLLEQINQGIGTAGRETAALLAVQQAARPTQTDKVLGQQLNDRLLSQALQALNTTDGMQNADAQNLLASQEFADFVRQMTGEDLAGNLETLSLQRGAVNDTTNTSLNLQDLGYNYNQQQIAGAAKLLPLQAEVANKQADLDFLTGMSGINANVGAINGQSIARRTQLLSSVPAKPGFLSTVASLGSASLPLISTFIKPRTDLFLPQQQQAPTLVDVYPDSPGYPQYNDYA